MAFEVHIWNRSLYNSSLNMLIRFRKTFLIYLFAIGIVKGNITELNIDSLSTNDEKNLVLLTNQNKSQVLAASTTELQPLIESLNETEDLNAMKTELLTSDFLNNISSGMMSSTETTKETSIDYRFRWIGFRNRPAYPPRLPLIPGIPSGFRNPITTPIPSKQLPSSPLHNPGFGGSSTNPVGFGGSVTSSFGNGISRSPMSNITRVEHISAECSDDYMKVIMAFNGTFNGLIYSTGYVHDENCIYVNGTGRNNYDFYIRLNQCGTLGRQEMYHPKSPGETRRRDQLMWNTLSIQYNSIIEEEWDEHYRVTCEYGSDFWKTVTFPSIGIDSYGESSNRVSTGSSIVFTINPPVCHMEIRRGFGIAGTRTSGPVTVGDPLTLLIHMKSEKAGFDILVKNCFAHNGGQLRLQLIDTNGCVNNEKLISPFRGTFNSNDGHQVTLYAYLKAFRFTGNPALYLECDIHMCHNKCPPQRCYWRNLSKRSIATSILSNKTSYKNSIVSESISLFQALEVRDEKNDWNEVKNEEMISSENLNDVCIKLEQAVMLVFIFMSSLTVTTIISIYGCVKLKSIKKDKKCVIDSFSFNSKRADFNCQLSSLSRF